ncbi:MAG: glycosyltransferase family 87 protein [Planctomycetota bacterium]
MRRVWKTLPVVLLLLYTGANLVRLGGGDPETPHHDFVAYHAAARAVIEGEDPYEPASPPGDPSTTRQYRYPPLTIWFFVPFGLFPYATAWRLFLGVKIAFALAVVLVWWFRFDGRKHPAVFLALALLAFNAAILKDLKAGNVTMIEQLPLWLGLAGFLAARYRTFAVLVAVSALFKLTNAFFLVLCLTLPRPARVRTALTGAGILGASLLLSGIVYPDHFRSFLHHAWGAIGEIRGAVSPSSVNLLHDFREGLASRLSVSLPTWTSWAAWAAFSATIVVLSLRGSRRLSREPGRDARLDLVLLACLVFVLISPRTKDYTCVLLVPAAFHIVTEYRRLPARWLLLLLLVLSARYVLPMALGFVYDLLWQYVALFGALLLWVLFLHEKREVPAAPNSA